MKLRTKFLLASLAVRTYMRYRGARREVRRSVKSVAKRIAG